MKIKIIESGFETYTGFFGAVEFKDGVSIDEVATKDVNTLASIIKIINADETGEEVGTLAVVSLSWDAPAVIDTLKTKGDRRREAAALVAKLLTGDAPASASASAPAATTSAPAIVNHTQESLEGVADKKGIAGLREIATPLGIKGTSISALIEGILASQSPIVTGAALLESGSSEKQEPTADSTTSAETETKTEAAPAVTAENTQSTEV